MSTQYRHRKTKKPRSRIVAAFLAFFFGIFGVHKFYLGQIGLGILFVLMFTFSIEFILPLTALLGLFDAIRLFTMSDEKFHRKYNRGARVNPTHREPVATREVGRDARRTARASSHRSPKRAAIQRANPFKNSGIKKYKDFDLEGAIIDFNKGLEINDQDIALHFNIANAYSLTEQKEKAYYHLDKAVDLGFADLELIKTKDDLAYVRIQPEWDSFVANGFQLKTGMMQSGSAVVEASIDTDDVLLSQLNKLADLRKKGLLSEAEFQLERKRIMRR